MLPSARTRVRRVVPGPWATELVADTRRRPGLAFVRAASDARGYASRLTRERDGLLREDRASSVLVAWREGKFKQHRQIARATSRHLAIQSTNSRSCMRAGKVYNPVRTRYRKVRTARNIHRAHGNTYCSKRPAVLENRGAIAGYMLIPCIAPTSATALGPPEAESEWRNGAGSLRRTKYAHQFPSLLDLRIRRQRKTSREKRKTRLRQAWPS
ncbi:hypothetical protein BD309DRAFT_505358 [Dichomitus squalens]|nr:hypothetical protein BD309DRAFT_505358 [Dichomitus squalens]